MRILIAIWVIVLIVVIGGFWYMNITINNMVKEVPREERPLIIQDKLESDGPKRLN